MLARHGLRGLREIRNITVAMLVAVAVVIGAASGYGLARAIPDARTAGKCSAGPRGSCVFPASPADRREQQERWALFGALITGVPVLAVLRPGRVPRG